MIIKNIASGSSGNATYIGTDSTHILIDAGISKKRICEGLSKIGISLNDIDALLITHEHSDHIGSLGVIERYRNIPLYASSGTLKAINGLNIKGVDENLFNIVYADECFSVGDINIKPLSISHDCAEPLAFRLESGKKSCAVVTDLGIYNDHLIDNLKGLDALLLEANHDIRMLETGPYPYYLKMRISGDRGHLSNEASGAFLSELLHDNIRHIILGHISRENNTKELAQLSVQCEIESSRTKYKAKDFEIKTATFDQGSDAFDF